MKELPINQILNGDALQHLKELPSESLDCVMSSPPYWALRNYGSEVETIWDAREGCEHDWNENIQAARGGYSEDSIVGNNAMIKREPVKSNFCSICGVWKGQLGLEPTFDLYIKHLCDVFDEIKRVLKNSGTCFVNIGDTYYSISGGKFMNDNIGSKDRNELKGLAQANKLKEGDELAQKNLCNIPARFSIAMQDRGWILRNVIIWHKPNCMPSSVKDRFTVDFEYVFFFVKNRKYFFEPQYDPIAESSMNDNRKDKGLVKHKSGKTILKQDLVGNPTYTGFNKRWKESQYAISGTCINSFGRNKRAVWTITTKPFPEAHFATYPEELCETPIKAGCPEFVCDVCGKPKEKIYEGREKDAFNLRVRDAKKGTLNKKSGFYRTNEDQISAKETDYNEKEYGGEGKKLVGYSSCSCGSTFSSGIVLDPFFGAGTTGLVALKLNRRFVGIELNKDYIQIAKTRLKPYLEQTKLEVIK